MKTDWRATLSWIAAAVAALLLAWATPDETDLLGAAARSSWTAP